MLAAIKSKKSLTECFHLIVVFMLMFFFRYLPAFSTVTPEGMYVLGMFLGTIYGWLFIGMMLPGFLCLIALALSPVITINEIYVQSFGNMTFLMVLFMWAVANILTQAKISDKLAIKLMSLKIVNGRPWVFLAVTMFATWFISLLLGGIIPLLIFYPIVGNICTRFGYPAYSKTSHFMLFGVLVADCLGQMSLPIKGSALALLGIYKSMDPNFILNFGQYMLFAIPFTLLICLVFIACTKFLFRVDLTQMKDISSSLFDRENARFDKRQCAILIVFAGILFLLLLPGLLSGGLIKETLNKLGSVGIAFVGIVVLSVVKVEGAPLIDFRSAVKDVSWDVLITVAACLPLMTLLTADLTGIKPMIMQLFMPILNTMSPMAFSILVVIIMIILTNTMSNYVAAIIGFTLTIVCGPQIGITATLPIIYTIVICSHLAYATPAASLFAQMTFANTEWFEPKQFMKYTVLMLIPLSIIGALIGIFWGSIVL